MKEHRIAATTQEQCKHILTGLKVSMSTQQGPQLSHASRLNYGRGRTVQLAACAGQSIYTAKVEHHKLLVQECSRAEGAFGCRQLLTGQAKLAATP